MKKVLYLLFIFCLLFMTVTGCSGKDAQQPDDSPANAVDVDLTLLSSTMVMAEVNNIIENSDHYIGKTIKINGPYVTSYYDVTGKYYHYVLIDSCCMGFEFILSGNNTYPDDYPESMEIIEIIGIFGSYEEMGQTYHYLAVDEIIIPTV